jgi:hypothetical protein
VLASGSRPIRRASSGHFITAMTCAGGAREGSGVASAGRFIYLEDRNLPALYRWTDSRDLRIALPPGLQGRNDLSRRFPRDMRTIWKRRVRSRRTSRQQLRRSLPLIEPRFVAETSSEALERGLPKVRLVPTSVAVMTVSKAAFGDCSHYE